MSWPCFAVFYSDFLRSNNGKSCSNITTDTMETFEFPTDYITDDASAMQLCERYCSKKEQCWGCSKSCQQGCQWNAVTKCKYHKELGSFHNTSISQKPGINNALTKQHFTKMNYVLLSNRFLCNRVFSI